VCANVAQAMDLAVFIPGQHHGFGKIIVEKDEWKNRPVDLDPVLVSDKLPGSKEDLLPNLIKNVRIFVKIRRKGFGFPDVPIDVEFF
jgi:hypothetical protein